VLEDEGDAPAAAEPANVSVQLAVERYRAQAEPEPRVPPPGAVLTLDQALRENPKRVLLEAIRAIFHRQGKYADVVAACCWAQRELASADGYRDAVFRQGWIVGKPGDGQ
jgi:hypothetical protein